MGAVAARFAGFRPGLDVLTPVRGVRTIFPAVDLATRVGGWPIERVAVVHGESGHGKTLFSMGLGQSFLLRDHFFSLVDAEQTTPEDWVRQTMRANAEHPGFSALRPRSYEETVDHVRRWAETIAEARTAREIPEDTTGICVVDSIGKLRPKRLLKAILAAGADGGDDAEEQRDPRRRKPPGGVDGMAGRAGQYKAFLNAAWLDDLIPLMAQTKTAIVLLTRESESTEAGLFGPSYHVTGGRHLVYDASLRVRVVSKGPIWRGEGKDRQMVGERHAVEVHKTKVAKRTEKVPTGDFCTSNGVLVPEGFDLARDLLDVGQELGVVELRGASYSFAGERIAMGEHNAVKVLHDRPEWLAKLEEAVRKQVDEVLDQERAARRPAAE